MSIRAAGEVFKATQNQTGQVVAIKKMAMSPENEKLLVTEIDIMKTSQHVNIVQYFDAFIQESPKREIWVVCHIVPSLFRFIILVIKSDD